MTTHSSFQKIDIAWTEKLSRIPNADSLQHSNVKKILKKNICHHTCNKLPLTGLLLANRFAKNQAQLANANTLT